MPQEFFDLLNTLEQDELQQDVASQSNNKSTQINAGKVKQITTNHQLMNTDIISKADKALKNFKRAFKHNLLNSKPVTHKNNNLSKTQRAGLLVLTNNPELIIKKAEKGSAVVVMNTKDYLREGYR